MDKIQFAKLVSFVSAYNGKVFDSVALEQLENLTNIIPVRQSWTIEAVNQLLYFISHDKKIDAIKLYRSITGAYLKDAKDAVFGEKPVYESPEV